MVRKIGAGSEGILGGDTVCSVKRANMQSGKLLGRIGFVVGFTGAVLFYLGPQWSVLCLPCPIVHPIPSTGLVSLQIALTTGLLQGLLFALLGLAIGFLLRAQAFEGGTESNPGYPIVKSRLVRSVLEYLGAGLLLMTIVVGITGAREEILMIWLGAFLVVSAFGSSGIRGAFARSSPRLPLSSAQRISLFSVGVVSLLLGLSRVIRQ
jgi:hypothetical protein